MKTALIDIIAGARPNFMKIAPIIRALERQPKGGTRLRYRLVHTGQHYDARMSGDFFEQLGIPMPDVNLEVGSGTQAEQTAGIMIGYERVLVERLSDLCLVVGDVTSTMACALTARKMQVPVAHVEAGIRSGDRTMPEEINRMATDAVTDWFFTTSHAANANLSRMGVADERVFFVGNTMVDTLLANIERLRPPPFWRNLGLEAKDYFVMTLHRPSNVDGERSIRRIIEAVGEGTRGVPTVFPVHPRTRKRLEDLSVLPGHVHPVEPQPYLEFNYLVRHARAVITDSGGITEEATMMGVPCMTLRNSTERPETVTVGTNRIIGADPAALVPALNELFAGDWQKGGIPDKWDGRAGERIVATLQDVL